MGRSERHALYDRLPILERSEESELQWRLQDGHPHWQREGREGHGFHPAAARVRSETCAARGHYRRFPRHDLRCCAATERRQEVREKLTRTYRSFGLRHVSSFLALRTSWRIGSADRAVGCAPSFTLRAGEVACSSWFRA